MPTIYKYSTHAIHALHKNIFTFAFKSADNNILWPIKNVLL